MDMKEVIYFLAGHEKELSGMGSLNCSDILWLDESLGDFNHNFCHDDLIGLGISEISDLINDFIDYCEEEL